MLEALKKLDYKDVLTRATWTFAHLCCRVPGSRRVNR